MRTVIRLLLVVVGLAASVVAGPAGVSTAAANQANRLSGFTIASIAPSPGEIVGVAHPLVVTFADRVTDRAAAERALDISSSVPLTGQSVRGQSVTGQSVTGRFEWIDNRTVHWVADEFWPAHSTVALSVGGRPTTIATGPAVIGVANISDHTFTVTIDGIGAGAAEVADGLIGGFRDVDCNQVPRAVSSGELFGIALVGLHFVARLAGQF
jgi:lipoprotein-anchoring transpeptidase ErfK/SrfK